MNKIYRDKIRKNQQNVISMFNMHHFLRHLVEGEGYKLKKFGFFEDLSSQKQCNDVLVYTCGEYQSYNYSNETYCFCK